MIIGLGGGIASGKSVAAQYLQQKYQFQIVDTDVLAREVVTPGQPAYEQVVTHFGPSILHADHSLNRSRLREIVFSDPEEKRWLESVTHPAVRRLMSQRLKTPSAQSVTLLVSPLLYESEQYKLCAYNILMTVPDNIKVERASARDNSSNAVIASIIQQQMPDDKKLEMADFVIINDSTLASLYQKLDALALKLIELARV